MSIVIWFPIVWGFLAGVFAYLCLSDCEGNVKRSVEFGVLMGVISFLGCLAGWLVY